MVFLFRGAAAKSAGNVASVWAKVPAGGACKLVSGILVTCDSFAVTASLKPLEPQPGDDGWCRYAVRVPEQGSSQCLYMSNKLKDGTTALVDAATLAPDDGTISPQSAEFWAPDAELANTLAALRQTVRSTMPF
jgi:hypothetical protein